MRRISTEYAQMGMQLARAIYDGRGVLLLDSGTRLDAQHLPVLSRLNVRELLVQDPRVDDVLIEPLISEEAEAQAVRELHRILDGNVGRDLAHIEPDVRPVERAVRTMVDGMCSAFMGEINAEGCLSTGNYEYIHPVKVAGLSLLIGKAAGMRRDEMVSLGMAAILQNIGYLLIPRNIFAILDASFEGASRELKNHPEYGWHILRRCQGLQKGVAETVLSHHERWDGSGYPNGLKRDQLPLAVRIMGIADTYHALVSSRHKHQPHAPTEAAEFITAYSGELFDPDLVQIFLRSVPLYPKGLMVRLNTGESGIVTHANPGYMGRPCLRICYDRAGNEVPPYDVDLTRQENQNKLVAGILEY